jgi:methylated-DNA-[protein]-cysteine S-methyltransferase
MTNQSHPLPSIVILHSSFVIRASSFLPHPLDTAFLKYRMADSKLSKRTVPRTQSGQVNAMNVLLSRDRKPPSVQRFAIHPRRDEFATVATTVFLTELGWMGVAGHDNVVAGIVFGYPSEERAARVLAERTGRRIALDAAPPWLRDVRQLLEEYAAGGEVDFTGAPLDLDYVTPFGRRVIAACRNIPRGAVCSYGELAEECGAPGAARAVGSVMAKNRHPLVVPCHRVVGASGSLGGYSAPGGLAIKRRLLAMEGAG